MPVLNFAPQFADAVASGEKTQTIRPYRKVPIVVGDTLYLFTGWQTPQVRGLKDVTCRSVQDIEITEVDISIGGHLLGYGRRRMLIERDGFDSLDDFRAFFRHHYGLPFRGVLIVWDKPETM